VGFSSAASAACTSIISSSSSMLSPFSQREPTRMG
jgi:hypothetical protein